MRAVVPALAVFTLVSTSLRAQCPDWVGEFTPGHADGAISASVVFDDGTGPALYVAGGFTRIGSTPVAGVARYDGTNITPVGAGFGGGAFVSSLNVLDLGAGPRLYATGLFTLVGSGAQTMVARWDGVQWNPLGAPVTSAWGGQASVNCITVYDFGSGPALYAGGGFVGTDFDCVRRFDGSNWVPVGGGPNANALALIPHVDALTVFDDGSGSKLYAGGTFLSVSGNPGAGVARWNGATWETATLGTGWLAPFGEARVSKLTVHDSGAGPALYAAGSFMIGANVGHLARFESGSWIAPAIGVNDHVTNMSSIAGSANLTGGLYLTGYFSSAGGQSADGIARFDGASFHPVGGPNAFGVLNSVTSFDSGTGARLHATGGFTLSSGGSLGVFDGTAWTMVGAGNAPNGVMYSVLSFDDDDDGRNSLFVVGGFQAAGQVSAFGFARYDRGSWSNPAPQLVPEGSGVGFAVLEEAGVKTPYALGGFRLAGVQFKRGVLRFEGGAWTPVGTLGQSESVYALARFDGGLGDALWAGTTAGLRRWNGAQWTVPPSTPTGQVRHLLTFDDGTGPALYMCSSFNQFFGSPAVQFGRWNGSAFDPLLGTGTWRITAATAMALYDDGTGERLYVAGYFSNAGATQQRAIARLDGTVWTPVATSFTLPTLTFIAGPHELFVHAGRNGPVLVVGGEFTSIDGIPASGLASFDGSSWSAFGAGLQSTNYLTVAGLTDHDFGDGAGPDLVVVGGFETAGGLSAPGLARYRECGDASAFCFGDGSGTACPCGNVGASGRGCGNSNFASGALLSVSGRAQISSDTLTLVCTGVSNGTPALFYQGTAQVNGGAGIVFGDGFACITGVLIRLGVRFTTSGEANFGAAAGPGPISQLGFVPGAGGMRHYGCRYRADVAFCTHAGFNYANAVNVTWAP